MEVYNEMLHTLGYETEQTEPSSLRRVEPESDDPYYDFNPVFTYSQLHEHSTLSMPVPYKRSTHFLAHLNQITGRNGVDALPRGLVQRVKKSRVKIMDPMAYHRIRKLLKKWGYSSPEYRHIFALIKSLGGPVVSVTYQQERTMRDDFDGLCDVFNERRPFGGHRKAFISYYVALQFLLQKQGISSNYTLPSIKDSLKFDIHVKAYAALMKPGPWE